MMLPPKCFERGCKHYMGIAQPDGTENSEKPVCEAYLDGIPSDIAYGDDPHTEVRKDQNNRIVFEASNNAEE